MCFTTFFTIHSSKGFLVLFFYPLQFLLPLYMTLKCISSAVLECYINIIILLSLLYDLLSSVHIFVNLFMYLSFVQIHFNIVFHYGNIKHCMCPILLMVNMCVLTQSWYLYAILLGLLLKKNLEYRLKHIFKVHI